MCYLGIKSFSGLSWEDRARLLHGIAEAGVLFLQLTGGEPTIDRLFPNVYRLASELGMMLSVSTNGSTLWQPRILNTLTACPPYRLTVSVYGATAEVYETVTARRGSFRAFTRGLAAAREAGLNLHLNVIVAQQNARQVDAMTALAENLGAPHTVYTNLSPTIYGESAPLTLQSQTHLRARKVFTSLKERAGVKRLACPFLWRFLAGSGHAGRRAGVQVERPGWTNDLEAGPSPGSCWIGRGRLWGMWVRPVCRSCPGQARGCVHPFGGAHGWRPRGHGAGSRAGSGINQTRRPPAGGGGQ
jgi:Radical SAM superfamily